MSIGESLFGVFLGLVILSFAAFLGVLLINDWTSDSAGAAFVLSVVFFLGGGWFTFCCVEKTLEIWRGQKY